MVYQGTLAGGQQARTHIGAANRSVQPPRRGIVQRYRTGKSSHPAVILQILRCYPRVAVLCRIPIAMGDENC